MSLLTATGNSDQRLQLVTATSIDGDQYRQCPVAKVASSDWRQQPGVATVQIDRLKLTASALLSADVNVRELLRCLRIETYLKDARTNRKETHVW